jgi:uncharacterized membrane protein
MKTEAPAAEPKPRACLDAHHRVFLATIVALGVFLSLQGRFHLPIQLIVAWDAFAIVDLVFVWIVISTRDPYEVRRTAGQQDASATFLFALVITAANASLFAAALLLGSAKGLDTSALVLHVSLAILSVACSWFLVHTLFAMRYAHRYYHDAHKVDRAKVTGGLIFPGDQSPTYMDFAYFSFVIGMTCQVSDVQISSRSLRRLSLLHGLISFAFNTAILAMFVNIIAGLF